MQKVIQRGAAARKQAQRRAVKATERERLVERKDTTRLRKEYNKATIDNIRASQAARWEDWEKGALAPKRDVGLASTTFGALDAITMHPPRIPRHQRRKFILFAPGDRVCVIRGRDQGKINEVTQVNADSETILVKDINVADIAVPEWAKSSMGIKSDIMPQPMPIPIDNVRHVIALEDKDQPGSTRDYIIQHAYGGPPFYERPPGSETPRYSRYISGLGLEIPWPKEELPQIKDGQWDTLRVEVDTQTWVPTLDNPPFPSTIIDELRNKYSKFRSRHDPEYVREKTIETYRQEYIQSQSLLTPRGELRARAQARGLAKRQSSLDADGNRIMNKETSRFINNFLNKNLTHVSGPASKGKKANAQQSV